MGTISKIVESLIAQRDDKVLRLTARSDEHSAWLVKELNAVRQLVKQNPRDNLKSGGGGVKKTQAPSSSSSTVKASYSPPAANDEKENMTAAEPSESKRQKRKSPETAREAVRQSPEQKRSSAAFEELAAAAGLPADLNRLKKEQLLQELEMRGETELSMKSLKKDLVDALRERLMRGKQAPPVPSATATATQAPAPFGAMSLEGVATIAASPEVEEQEDGECDADSPMEEAPAITAPDVAASTATTITAVAAATSPAVRSPQRKGSLLSTFRSNLAAGGEAGEAEAEAEAEKEARLQAEFERRTREAAARKSLAGTQPVQAAAPEVAGGKTSTGSMGSVGSVGKVGSGTKASPALLIPSLAAMMISPEKGAEAEEEEEEGEINESAAAAATAAPLALQPASSEDTWCEVSSPARDEPAAPAPAPAPELKKPSNIVASQTSFVGGGEKAKAVVPALEKARQLKAVEDAKAAQKKKDAEARQAVLADKKAGVAAPVSHWDRLTKKPTPAAVPAVAAAPVAAAVINKVASNAASFDITVTNTAAPAAAAAALPAAPSSIRKMGGLFSFLGGKKAPARPASPVKDEPQAQGPGPNPAALAAPQTPPSGPVKAQAVVVSASRGPAAATSTATILSITPPPEVPVMAPLSPAAAPTPPAPVAEAPAASLAAADEEDMPVEEPAAEAAPEPVPIAPVAPTPAIAPVVSAPPAAPLAPAPSIPAIPTPAPAPAPVVAPAPEPEEEESQGYQIDDRESSGSDGSGTDDEARQKKSDSVPEWARGVMLRDALERQYGLHGQPMDPDLIFPEVQTCSLEEIFGVKEGKTGIYNKRSSSARWEQDELSLVEKRTYRSQMGYAGATPLKK